LQPNAVLPYLRAVQARGRVMKPGRGYLGGRGE
jgi:hypothetical protein